jgi:hypothetical protein
VDERAVDVAYVLTRKDLGRLGRHGSRRSHYRYDIPFLVAVGAGFMAVWPTGQDTGVRWPALVSLVAWLVYSQTLGRAIRRQVVGQPVRASFSETGVTFHEAAASSTWRWSAFGRVDETRDHLFILASSLRGWVLPKRCFASEEDIAAVRAWVAAAREQGGVTTADG